MGGLDWIKIQLIQQKNNYSGSGLEHWHLMLLSKQMDNQTSKFRGLRILEKFRLEGFKQSK